jgi:antitoxin component of MazEF toxin-antitoxin module
MPHIETRKLIRIGNSLAVTIPKPWLRYFNLTDKDKVTVLSNGKVVIEPQNKPVQRRRTHAAARR